MGMKRRIFLKVSGIAALGLAGGAAATETLKYELPELETKDEGHKAPTRDKDATCKRYAMVIDLSKCREQGGEDCKDCQVACHTVHNVPTLKDPKDEIKWIWKESFHHAFHEEGHDYLDDKILHGPTLVLCNHCDNPPCVRVCPTQATWKRKEDGVVMMDWHRCIGCRYCVVACPYGSRSFNWYDPRPYIERINEVFPTRTRGVVEKCTFCDERLARGQIPACVEACKHGALQFGDLNDSQSTVRKVLEQNFTIRRKPGLGTNPEVYYIV
jgi:Fe-S-cluster-containing dehydrogenase component